MFAGEDHLNEPIYIEATKKLKEMGVATIYIPRTKDISSTDIRRKIVREFSHSILKYM